MSLRGAVNMVVKDGLRRQIALLAATAALSAAGAEWHVNHEWGDDDWQGTAERPFKTFKHALAKLRGGDTLHVQKTKTPYTERFGELGTRAKGHPYDGTPEQPTVIEGHGAELTSLTRMGAAAWEQMPDGTWRTKPHHNVVVMGGAGHYNAFPFLFLDRDGRRTPFRPADERSALLPMEMYWSFKWNQDAAGRRTRDDDYGSLYIRLPEGLTPANCDLLMPHAGNLTVGADNVVVRDLNFSWATADCIDTYLGTGIVFENLEATDCLDQNISAHATAGLAVRWSHFARALAGCVYDVPYDMTRPCDVRYEGCLVEEGSMGFKGNPFSCFRADSCVFRKNGRKADVYGQWDASITVSNCLMYGESDADCGACFASNDNAAFTVRNCTAVGRRTAFQYVASTARVDVAYCDFGDAGEVLSVVTYNGRFPLPPPGTVRFRHCRFPKTAACSLDGRTVDLETLRKKGFVFEDCTLGGARRRGVGSTLADRLPAEAWTKEHLRKELNR